MRVLGLMVWVCDPRITMRGLCRRAEAFEEAQKRPDHRLSFALSTLQLIDQIRPRSRLKRGGMSERSEHPLLHRIRQREQIRHHGRHRAPLKLCQLPKGVVYVLLNRDGDAWFSGGQGDALHAK